MADPITTAAAMREVAAYIADNGSWAGADIADDIRALPIAEREVPPEVREWCGMYDRNVKSSAGWATYEDRPLREYFRKEYPDACK